MTPQSSPHFSLRGVLGAVPVCAPGHKEAPLQAQLTWETCRRWLEATLGSDNPRDTPSRGGKGEELVESVGAAAPCVSGRWGWQWGARLPQHIP